MKRPKYNITVEGETMTATKSAWNSALRHTRDMVRSLLREDERSAEYTGLNGTREELNYRITKRGTATYVTDKGRKININIELDPSYES